MRIASFFRDRLAFTPNEMKAVVMLSATFLIGLGIRWFQSSSSRPPEDRPFEYARDDSVFAARSRALIEIPVLDHPKNLQRPTSRKPTPAPLSVNINTASKDQLMRLSGIGESYAMRIIQYREENGPFATVNDLQKVRGIGPKKLERLRPYVTVK